jgi:hypothetical protein
MKKVAIGILLGVLGVMAWQRVTKTQPAVAVSHTSQSARDSTRVETAVEVSYKCDGRTRCSEMTSCEEASFFLQNCPGVKMDGDQDGLPCEDRCGKGR